MLDGDCTHISDVFIDEINPHPDSVFEARPALFTGAKGDLETANALLQNNYAYSNQAHLPVCE